MSPGLGFAAPWTLALLLPWLISWWLVPRFARTQSTGSTQLWREVLPQRRWHRRRWVTLTLGIVAILTAARPEWHAGLPSSDWTVVQRQRGERRETVIEVVANADRCAGRPYRVELHDEEGEPIDAREWTPTIEARTLTVDLESPHRRHRLLLTSTDGDAEFDVWIDPVTPADYPIVDLTGSPAVRRALVALELSGEVRLVPQMGLASLAFVRESDPRAQDSRTSAVIVPDVGARITQQYPVPEVPVRPDPWIAGLHAERWDIPARLDIAHPVDRVVLDSSGGALIGVGRDAAVIAFDPDQTSLTRDPAWPVLIGRIVDEFRPRSPSTMRFAGGGRALPQRWVEWLSIASLFALALLFRPRSWTVAIAALGFAVLPSIPFGSVSRVSFRGSADPAAWRAVSDRLPDGGILEVPEDAALPLDETALGDRLRQRAIAVEWTPTPDPTWTVSPTELEVGASITVRTSGTTASPALERPDGQRLTFPPPTDAANAS
ncbi:MAG: BatA domain-containing protein, partial [Planctomycetes bacterium]|nr:BatA domain-containing protein [Planctomycetota bacterium]